MDGVRSKWQNVPERHLHMGTYYTLTSPAVPHGHFAHPGLSNGGTGYCVLGWFLYNVPRSGLQTPLIATGFVSPSAGSPFTPLAHLAALCRDMQNQGCAVKQQQSRSLVATQRSSFNRGWRRFTGVLWPYCVWSHMDCLFYTISRSIENLLKTLCRESKAGVRSFWSVCVVARTSTLHSVLQRGKALRALVKAAPFV